MRREFEVGERYRNQDIFRGHTDIEITKVKGKIIYFKVISGKPMPNILFKSDSPFAIFLEKLSDAPEVKKAPALSENQRMAKELKEIVTALEAEGFTHKEAVKFILAVASGKAGK